MVVRQVVLKKLKHTHTQKRIALHSIDRPNAFWCVLFEIMVNLIYCVAFKDHNP